jgi:hypothetical protein
VELAENTAAVLLEDTLALAASAAVTRSFASWSLGSTLLNLLEGRARVVVVHQSLLLLLLLGWRPGWNVARAGSWSQRLDGHSGSHGLGSIRLRRVTWVVDIREVSTSQAPRTPDCSSDGTGWSSGWGLDVYRMGKASNGV